MCVYCLCRDILRISSIAISFFSSFSDYCCMLFEITKARYFLVTPVNQYSLHQVVMENIFLVCFVLFTFVSEYLKLNDLNLLARDKVRIFNSNIFWGYGFATPPNIKLLVFLSLRILLSV